MSARDIFKASCSDGLTSSSLWVIYESEHDSVWVAGETDRHAWESTAGGANESSGGSLSLSSFIFLEAHS